MPTCKECIHNLVCAIYGPELIDIFENGEYCIEYKNEADVVEVVRCKDCTHRNTPDCYLWYGSVGDTDYFIGTSDDFYCSYGERSENGT